MKRMRSRSRVVFARRDCSPYTVNRPSNPGFSLAIAARPLVAQNAIVQQSAGPSVVQTEQWRHAFADPRPVGLAEPYVSGQYGEANLRLNPSVFIKHGRAEPVEAEPAAALPAYALGDAALLALYYFPETRHAVCDGVLAHLNADVAPAHLVSDCGRRAGAKEGVEY